MLIDNIDYIRDHHFDLNNRQKTVFKSYFVKFISKN